MKKVLAGEEFGNAEPLNVERSGRTAEVSRGQKQRSQ